MNQQHKLWVHSGQKGVNNVHYKDVGIYIFFFNLFKIYGKKNKKSMYSLNKLN